MRVAVFNQTVIGIPVSILVNVIRNRLGAEYLPEHLPSALIIVRDLAAFVVIEEIGFYYTHR